MKTTKSPSPDGQNSGLFRDTWALMGDDIIKDILEYLNNGKLPGQVNATVITLIPKVQTPKQVRQFRPISCCNVVYKCIPKSRLK